MSTYHISVRSAILSSDTPPSNRANPLVPVITSWRQGNKSNKKECGESVINIFHIRRECDISSYENQHELFISEDEIFSKIKFSHLTLSYLLIYYQYYWKHFHSLPLSLSLPILVSVSLFLSLSLSYLKVW